jgi:hypothetical protein
MPRRQPEESHEQQEGQEHNKPERNYLANLIYECKMHQMIEVVDEVWNRVHQPGPENRLYQATLRRDRRPDEEQRKAEVERAHIAHQVLVVGRQKSNPGMTRGRKGGEKGERGEESPGTRDECRKSQKGKANAYPSRRYWSR